MYGHFLELFDLVRIKTAALCGHFWNCFNLVRIGVIGFRIVRAGLPSSDEKSCVVWPFLELFDPVLINTKEMAYV